MCREKSSAPLHKQDLQPSIPGRDASLPAWRHGGFTLVELLVAMTLMLVLATIAILFVPSFQDGEKAATGARQVMSMLHIAKSQATRDRAPRGVRLLFTNSPTQITQLQFIEQPGDFYDPKSAGPAQLSGSVVTFAPIKPGDPPAPDFWGGFGPTAPANWPVQAGDYLEINGGGALRKILAVQAPNQLVLHVINTMGSLTSAPGTSPATISVTNPANISPGMSLTLTAKVPGALTPDPKTQETVTVLAHATGSPIVTVSRCSQAPGAAFYVQDDPSTSFPVGCPYRIIRAPRVVAGEEPLTLPVDVAVQLDATAASTAYDPPVSSPPLPPGLAAVPGAVWHDIMFSPSGAVIGTAAANDKVILWVRDVTQPDVIDNNPLLVCVYTRSGLIAAHPVDVTPGGNPYGFTIDGKSSGE